MYLPDFKTGVFLKLGVFRDFSARISEGPTLSFRERSVQTSILEHLITAGAKEKKSSGTGLAGDGVFPGVRK